LLAATFGAAPGSTVDHHCQHIEEPSSAAAAGS
jgi:hypothetical protein